MLSPSNLYESESGYFFYTSDNRYFNIYFTPYTFEFNQEGELRSEEYLMIGLENIPELPLEYADEELSFANGNPAEEINDALISAIQRFFEVNPDQVLIYILSTQKGQHKARKRRFKKIVANLGNEISCINYELDEFPDMGFLILTNNPNTEEIDGVFREYINQFYNEG